MKSIPNITKAGTIWFLSITVFLFLILSPLAFAQGSMQDVVYLINGSIIKGIIIEQVPNKSIKIQTKDGSVFFYRMDEIDSF